MSWGDGYWGFSEWGGLFGPLGGGDDDDIPPVVIGADLCIHDHTAQALERLIERFRRPKIQALLSAFIAPVQQIEEMFCQMLHNRSLTTSEGEQLNVIGRIVGQRDRGTLTDPEYLNLINARILVNQSSGTPEELLHIARLVLSSGAGILVYTISPPATQLIDFTDMIVGVEQADQLIMFLGAATSAGVRTVMEFSPAPTEDMFTFNDGPGFDSGILGGARSN